MAHDAIMAFHMVFPSYNKGIQLDTAEDRVTERTHGGFVALRLTTITAFYMVCRAIRFRGRQLTLDGMHSLLVRHPINL